MERRFSLAYRRLLLTFPHEMAHPLTLGTQYQLGNHRATYKPSTAIEMIVGGVSLLVSAMLGISGGFSFNFSSPSVMMTLVSGSLGLAFIIHAYRNSMLRVFVYDYGLISVGRESLHPISWQNVQAVRHDVRSQSIGISGGGTVFVHTYTLNCTDGAQLKLDNIYKDLQQLGESIERETAHHLYPQALDAYRMGQDVVFGSLTVTQRGLYCGGKLLTWMEMKNIKIYKDGVAIKKQGKILRWAFVEMADVPNIEVFRMLIQHITGVRPQDV